MDTITKEKELATEALNILDSKLKELGSGNRSLVDTSEVTDLFLDVRVLLAQIVSQ